jgi:hypothetical protein
MARFVNTLPYLLLKANAEQLPLRDSSVSLVLATPPYLGEKRIRARKSIAPATRLSTLP